MQQFLAFDSVIVVQDASALEQSVARLLENPNEAAAIAGRACQVVKREQGATDRHVQVILDTLDSVPTMGPQPPS
jgi:3-deoxy-D-manno-octulosonic-acid transferase